VARPHAPQPHAAEPQHKKNQNTKKNQGSSKSTSGAAIIDRTISPQPPISNLQSPVPSTLSPIPHLQFQGCEKPGSPDAAPPLQAHPSPAADATTFAPCALARFIAAHSDYRFPPGEQHERLCQPVMQGDGAHPAPDELFLDPSQREAFQAWVLDKIAWAEGSGGPRKPLKALVSVLRNYAQPTYGWLIYRDAWSLEKGGHRERRSRAPGYRTWPEGRSETPGRAQWPGYREGQVHERWPGGPGPGASPEARASRQRHWQQVAALLGQAGSPLG
jgi:hypothetical protein